MPDKQIAEKPIHAALVVVVMLLFCVSYVFPFFFKVPPGDAGVIILNSTKVIENVVLAVVFYYFGSTASNTKRNEAITDAALAKPAEPQAVTVINTPDQPVPTEQQ